MKTIGYRPLAIYVARPPSEIYHCSLVDPYIDHSSPTQYQFVEARLMARQSLDQECQEGLVVLVVLAFRELLEGRRTDPQARVVLVHLQVLEGQLVPVAQ